MDITNCNYGMGWVPDHPDIRDFTEKTDEVSSKLLSLGQKDSIKKMISKQSKIRSSKVPLKIPPSVDLRQWFTPIENQQSLGSCTAHAGIGLVEYFENKSFGKFIDASRLFLYKVSRDLLNWTGDTGAYVRTTMKALTLFGVPPEQYYPYVVSNFDMEPSAFLFAYAQNYQAISYYKLDPVGIKKEDLLGKIKTYLAMGLPSMFGFTVYNSYTQANTTGKIPFPSTGDRAVGGHAIVAAGYDNDIKIRNTNMGGVETKGALLIRNSWGTDWGESGYGWLPYEYVNEGLAIDWWSLLKNEWVDTENL
jgi:C1A family cysteine protease